MDAIYDKLLAALEHAPFVAAFLGIILAALCAEFVAHMLPPTWDAWQTDRAIRLCTLGVGLCGAWALLMTVQGFVIGLIVGFGGPFARWIAQQVIYWKWPALQPKVLRDNP